MIVLGHPRPASLGGALAQAFAQGARAAGTEVRLTRVADLAFQPDVSMPSPSDQSLEPDLVAFRRDLEWAEHMVFVYPTWWGTFPARMKALLDRALTPGFAFHYQHDGTYRPLLSGRTAEIITTMDTPYWVYRWIYRAPGHQALAASTLGFCGIRVVRKTALGPVIRSSPAQREGWVQRVRGLGLRLRGGARSPVVRTLVRAGDWLAAMRLQFYPMSWIAYSVGALAVPGQLDPAVYWLGLLALFLLELGTVFSNDWFDLESDRRNTHYGPFNGGSRVLVDRRISRRALGRAAVAAVAGFVPVAVWLSLEAGLAAALWLGLLAALAIGYTVPPVKLSYRGWGELDVAFTHSAGVLLAGHLLQGGTLGDPLPWLLSLPLMLSILPAIILAGIPDLEADRSAGKRTLPVRLGVTRAIEVALAAVVTAAALGLAWWILGLVGGLYGAAIVLAALHAAWLGAALLRYRRERPDIGRIDGLLVKALTFLLWFCVLPLINLL